jgi:hypothetical protein
MPIIETPLKFCITDIVLLGLYFKFLIETKKIILDKIIEKISKIA